MTVIEAQTKPKLFTYEDYMREVEAGIVDPCEYVDGVRVELTAPNWPHQQISLRLSVILAEYIDRIGGDGGAAPTDLMIRESPLVVREPDLFYATEATLEKHGEFPESGPIRFPVDLVVEIISPTERRSAKEGKLRDYAAIGVRECWVVSPQAQDITVLTLADGVYQKADVFIMGERLISPTLPGLEVDIDKLFAPRNRRSSAQNPESQP